MDDYNEYRNESDNMTQPEPQPEPQPVFEAEPVLPETPAPAAAPEQPTFEPEPEPQPAPAPAVHGFSAPESFAAGADRDEDYRYAVPEARRSAYSDAGYVPRESAPEVPRSYHYSPVTEKPKKQKKARRGMGTGAIIALCLICAILGGLVCGTATGAFRKDKPVSADETSPIEIAAPEKPAESKSNDSTTVFRVAGSSGGKTVTTETVESGSEMSATDIYYDLAIKQVVGVTTEITYTNYFGFTSSGAVSGSGFLISSDGYILTNNHVIEDAVAGGYEVKVLTYDGTEYVANVVGYEEDNDVAVLKIEGSGFDASTIGDSDSMMVGEKVYAVGNPLGELEYTMTSGMVSALDRVISSRDSSGVTKTVNMFQIDAAINSGNSGGPIYNSRGEVIGIATSKYSDTGIEGLGFAIPINDAIKIANDLISDGYVQGKAYMGVNVGTVTASAAQYYGLVEGAIVASVNKGGCAEKAGLQENDIIVAIDDTEITSRDELISAKKDYRAGDSAVLKVYRGGKYLELTIVFDEETPELLETDGEKTDEQQSQQPQQQMPSDGYGSYYDFFSDFFGGFPFGH